MGKEAKIGLAVLGVLLGIFAGLLIRKFVLADGAATSEANPPPAASNLLAVPQEGKPTVVTAQKDAAGRAIGGEHGAWTRNSHGGTGSASTHVPSGSYMPAENLPQEPAPNSRYAQDADSTPGESEPLPAEGATRANPFSSGQTTDAGTAEPTPAGQAAAPKPLDVAPDGASALDARKAPARANRNPLRRLSAEMPLDENPSGPDLSSGAAPTNDSGASDPDALAPDAIDDTAVIEPAAEPQAPAATGNAIDSTDVPAAQPALGGSDELPDEMPAEEPPRSRYEPRPADQPTADQTPIEPALVATRPVDGRYTIEPNDNLWKISEKVYGNGRYFKAIGEHNRARMPYPDRLSAGEVIEVPPAAELEDRYPDLCPKQRRSAVVKTRTQPERPRPRAGSDTYVIEDGDTLFDIARYELGKASRWGEIYELNRDVLGEDFDYLQPGLELKLPPRPAGAEATANEPDSRYLR